MTWEIVSGLAVLLGALISIMNIVVKVNRSLISLEETVRRLQDYIEKQDGKNGHFFTKLNILDKRVTLLEEFSSRGRSPRKCENTTGEEDERNG